MTLVEAFGAVGPIVDENEACSAVRSQACSIILQELRTLAANLNAACRDDLVQEVCAALIRSGPRGLRLDGPQSDEDVRAFLRTSLRNGQISIYRRTRREDPYGVNLDELPAIVKPMDVQIDEGRAQEALRWAREWFHSIIVPSIGHTLKARKGSDGFLEAMAELRDIAEGRANFESILARHSRHEDESASNRLYQKHSRARKRILEWARTHLQSQGLDKLHLCALGIVILELQSRHVESGLDSLFHFDSDDAKAK